MPYPTGRNETEPGVMVEAIGDPFIALAASIVLQAKADLDTFPDAVLFLRSPWFDDLADILNVPPATLRAWLGVAQPFSIGSVRS